jgi:hypothetical protein
MRLFSLLSIVALTALNGCLWYVDDPCQLGTLSTTNSCRDLVFVSTNDASFDYPTAFVCDGKTLELPLPASTRNGWEWRYVNGDDVWIYTTTGCSSARAINGTGTAGLKGGLLTYCSASDYAQCNIGKRAPLYDFRSL